MNLTDAWFQVALVYLVLQSPLVVFAGWFAPKMKANRSLWILAAAIPWIGLLASYALILRAFGKLLDATHRKNEFSEAQHLERRLGIGMGVMDAHPDTAPVFDSALSGAPMQESSYRRASAM